MSQQIVYENWPRATPFWTGVLLDGPPFTIIWGLTCWGDNENRRATIRVLSWLTPYTTREAVEPVLVAVGPSVTAATIPFRYVQRLGPHVPAAPQMPASRSPLPMSAPPTPDCPHLFAYPPPPAAARPVGEGIIRAPVPQRYMDRPKSKYYRGPRWSPIPLV
ncbi:uncharacterized protein DFL_004341 [Arthrobotrys flagrans]|uniref:Uncharacterized protein n=1 Tax=Arthrobotrys flagrans TaxID=97331 RepID=A0A437A4T3_ARTFL|nr:hypothetical protein DFL_004341 [Arthrobotrys flagrans]